METMNKARIKRCDDSKKYFQLGDVVIINKHTTEGAWLFGKDVYGNFTEWHYSWNEFEPIDTVVESVIEQFKERSAVGIKKYNTTLDRKDLTTIEWLSHLQMELMDATLYAEKLIQQEDLLKQSMIVIKEHLDGNTVTTAARYLHFKYYGHDHIQN